MMFSIKVIISKKMNQISNKQKKERQMDLLLLIDLNLIREMAPQMLK